MGRRSGGLVAVGTIAVAIALAFGLVAPTPAPRRPNLVVVVVDTLRADHVSTFGYARETAPRLTALARQGTSFRNVHSQAPYTTKSIESLITGDLPAPEEVSDLRQVPEWRETLAERMRAAGYTTVGFAANPYIAAVTGYHQGFDHFETKNLSYANADDLLGHIDTWLGEARERPFFLYAHYMDVHAPYAPPQRFQSIWADPDYDGRVKAADTTGYLGKIHENGFAAFEQEWGRPFRGPDLERVVSLYDGSIRYFDDRFAKLVEALRAHGVWDDTYLLLVADHGEEFLEHGDLGHGKPLYQGQIHVPAFLWGPDVPAGRVVDEPVAVMDMMPTLLDLLGLAAPDGLFGRSRMSLVAGLDSNGDAEPGFVVSARPGTADLAVRRGDLKYMRDASGELLFDLDADPGEQSNLVASDRYQAELALLRAEAARADRHMHAYAERQDVAAPAVELSDEVTARLRELGYVDEGR